MMINSFRETYNIPLGGITNFIDNITLTFQGYPLYNSLEAIKAKHIVFDETIEGFNKSYREIIHESDMISAEDYYDAVKYFIAIIEDDLPMGIALENLHNLMKITRQEFDYTTAIKFVESLITLGLVKEGFGLMTCRAISNEEDKWNVHSEPAIRKDDKKDE